MVKHIVIWRFKPEADKTLAPKIKQELEALQKIIEGVISINVIITPLESSNMEVMLDSTYENENALKYYLEHPEHKRVGQLVRANLTDRACMDYEV